MCSLHLFNTMLVRKALIFSLSKLQRKRAVSLLSASTTGAFVIDVPISPNGCLSSLGITLSSGKTLNCAADKRFNFLYHRLFLWNVPLFKLFRDRLCLAVCWSYSWLTENIPQNYEEYVGLFVPYIFHLCQLLGLLCQAADLLFLFLDREKNTPYGVMQWCRQIQWDIAHWKCGDWMRMNEHYEPREYALIRPLFLFSLQFFGCQCGGHRQ